MWFRTALFDRNPLQENVYQQNIQTLPLKYFGCILPETSLHAIFSEICAKSLTIIHSLLEYCMFLPVMTCNRYITHITRLRYQQNCVVTYFYFRRKVPVIVGIYCGQTDLVTFASIIYKNVSSLGCV